MRREIIQRFITGTSWSSYWATRTITGLEAESYSDVRIDLSWTNNGTADYTGHKIYRSTDNVTFTLVDTIASIETSYSAVSLTAGTQYYFKVAPYKGTNIGTLSSSAFATTIEEIAYALLNSIGSGEYNIMSSLAQNPTNKNKVINTYFSGTVDDYGLLKIRTSLDKGQSFGASSTAYDVTPTYRIAEQHTEYTSDGRLHILVTKVKVADSVCYLDYLYSDNDGVSFTVSDISALVSDATYVIYRNSGGLVENNGVLLSGFYSWNAAVNSFRKLCLRLVNGVWTKVTIETTSTNESEMSLVSLGGDYVLAIARNSVTGQKDFIQYLSSDNGLTWTRQGQINFGIYDISEAWPAQLRSFRMHGELIVVLYFPRKTDAKLYAIYGIASEIIEMGLTGWNYNTIKNIRSFPANHYHYHGDTLHYNNNYNAIGSWPEVADSFADSDLRLFEIDTTDYDTLVLALFPAAYSADSESNAFNAVNPTNPTAIVNLVGGLKQYGIWTKIKAAYPMIGGTAALHKYNLINPADSDAAFRLDFNGTWTHAATGAKPNGTDGYADTHLKPATHLTQYSVHLGFYSRTNNTENKWEMASYDDAGTTDPNLGISLRVASRFHCYNGFNNADAAIGANVANTLGSTFGSRTANNVNFIYYKGTTNGLKNATTAASTVPNYNMYIGAWNGKDTAAFFSSKECAFATIGDGLTLVEIHNYARVIHFFQKALNRNV